MSWNILRGLLAFLLVISFYVLVGGLAIFLFWIPFAELFELHRIHFQLAAVCWGGTISLLWALWPAGDRFVVPGLRLVPTQHPDLFRILQSVATATQQPMPSEVYLTAEVNAFVLQRGGFLGFKSSRVMALGLPLMHQLSQEQLKAVVAHEFGHFAKGDTAIGAWLYQTRAAIARGAEGLDNRQKLLRSMFRWYANIFVRATHGISRQQEFIADHLAATVTSPKTMQQTLRTVEEIGFAFQLYMRGEVLPLLKEGFQPPVVQGFNAFLAVPEVKSNLEKYMKQTLGYQKMQAFDTHPPLRQRLEALAKLPKVANRDVDTSPLASSLLRDFIRLEQQIYKSFQIGSSMPRKALAWSDISVVYQEIWRKRVTANKKAFSSMTFQNLSDSEMRKQLSRTLTLSKPDLEQLNDQQAGRYVRSIVGASLMLALHAHGFETDAPIGQAISATKKGATVQPFELLEQLFVDQNSANNWIQFCQDTGITNEFLDQPEKSVVRPAQTQPPVEISGLGFN